MPDRKTNFESGNEMTTPCSQEGRISHIETLVEIELKNIGKSIDNMDNRMQRIESKLNNGLSTAIQENTKFRQKLELQKEEQDKYDGVNRRQSTWNKLPWWKKISIIFGIAVFLFRPEIRDLVTIIVDHYLTK